MSRVWEGWSLCCQSDIFNCNTICEDLLSRHNKGRASSASPIPSRTRPESHLGWAWQQCDIVTNLWQFWGSQAVRERLVVIIDNIIITGWEDNDVVTDKDDNNDRGEAYLAQLASRLETRDSLNKGLFWRGERKSFRLSFWIFTSPD